jgi:hypothetical protein
MDIVNFDALKAQGRIIDPSQVDPNEDYFIIGKYTKHYTTNSYKYTDYPVYAIKAGDVMGAIPTLQQVLDFNHDLLDGNNYQGTGAGVGNTGSTVIAIGFQAGFNNTGNNVNALGTRAARTNTGGNINAIGQYAAQGNTANNINAIGANAGLLNTGEFLTAIGQDAGNENTGFNVEAIGSEAGMQNIGNNVIAIGKQSAASNTGNNVIVLGNQAGVNNGISGVVIIANTELKSFANYAAATDPLSLLSITIGNGAVAGNTYLYHDQATNSIGAVRL